MRESMSGILYNYIEVKNYYTHSSKWLKSIYDNPIIIKKKEVHNDSVITKLIVDGKRP